MDPDCRFKDRVVLKNEGERWLTLFLPFLSSLGTIFSSVARDMMWKRSSPLRSYDRLGSR